MTSYIVYLVLLSAAFYAGRLSMWWTCEKRLAKRDAEHAARLNKVSMSAKIEGVKAEKFAEVTKHRSYNHNAA